MNIYNVWEDFKNKFNLNNFEENDFTDEMRPFLMYLLCGKEAQKRREKFINSPFEIIDGEIRKSILLKCYDDDYRFDFEIKKDKWKLCFIECITLPLNNINNFPYSNFITLSEKEIWIRAEKNISKIVNFFNILRNIYDLEKTLTLFYDGAGEFICARSWVPFYNDSKSFIMYSGWIENKINGENITIECFTNEKCVIRFIKHLWFRVYNETGHIKTQISLEDYKKLFEYIWQDRAFHSGWNIQYNYENGDTILVFTKKNV